MAFAAASSRRVAAAEPLGFFGRLPNKVGTALRFFPPPGAPGAAEEPAPGWLAPGRWRGATSPSASSSGQSAKVAEGLKSLAVPPPPSASSSRAAAPRSGSSTSLSAGRQGTREPALRCRLVDGGGDSDQSRLVRPHKTNSARKKTIQRKKEKATHHGRGVGAGVRLLAEPPILQELAVREVVHHEGHLFVRHVLGAHPTRVAVPAHLAYHVRAALEWENSARDKGGRQVRTSQPL